jgi:hypothetical protein
MTWERAVSMPIESCPRTMTLRPLREMKVFAARTQSIRASAVFGVMRGSRPVSGQVTTFRCASLPYCAKAPLRACAKTTPGLGPLLPQVRLRGVSLGNCWMSEMALGCGKAQVSGTQTRALALAPSSSAATWSACGSPSTSVSE